MGPHKPVKEKSELAEQLAIQIHCKNQGIKWLVWGVALGILNLALDGLYVSVCKKKQIWDKALTPRGQSSSYICL